MERILLVITGNIFGVFMCKDINEALFLVRREFRMLFSDHIHVEGTNVLGCVSNHWK